MAELIGKATGIGLAFISWLGVQVLGGSPAASYLDIFLIAAFAAATAMFGERRAAHGVAAWLWRARDANQSPGAKP